MGWKYTRWDVTDQHGCWWHNGVAALRNILVGMSQISMAVGGIMGWEYTRWDVTDKHGCWRHNGVAALRGFSCNNMYGCFPGPY